MTDTVFIIAGEPRPTLRLEWGEPVTSPITHQPLRTVTVNTGTVAHDLLDDLREELAAAAVKDTDGRSWNVSSWSEQISDGRSSFTFELVEDDRVKLNTLAFGSVTLEDLVSSSVEDSNGLIIVEVLADVDAATSEAIEDAIAAADNTNRTYFPVTLPGVRQDPLSMRFGRCLWRELDDERIRHQLILVSEAGDSTETQSFRFNHPEIARLIDITLTTQARPDAVLNALHGTGAIDAAALERIATAKPALRAARVFDRDDKLGDN